MRSAVLPVALLASAMGLALSYTTPKVAMQCAGLMLVLAFAVAILPIAVISEDIAFAGCWVTIIAAGISVHLPKQAHDWLPRLLAVAAGLWAGLAINTQGDSSALLIGLPCLLLFIPGQMVVKRNWGIAIKVACSWLIAISVLEIGLMFVPTPGYKPDHMD